MRLHTFTLELLGSKHQHRQKKKLMKTKLSVLALASLILSSCGSQYGQENFVRNGERQWNTGPVYREAGKDCSTAGLLAEEHYALPNYGPYNCRGKGQ